LNFMIYNLFQLNQLRQVLVAPFFPIVKWMVCKEGNGKPLRDMGNSCCLKEGRLEPVTLKDM
jgi:hypothetical protein